MKIMNSTLALALATTIGVAACSDPTTIDDHLEVDAVAVYVGLEVEERARYTRDDDDPATIALDQGAHDVRFVLLDSDGLPISEDDHGEDEEEHELRIVVGDMDVLTWTPEAEGDEGVHDFVEFHGELEALQPGTTTLDLCVPHGAHCDFEATIPVTVVAP